MSGTNADSQDSVSPPAVCPRCGGPEHSWPRRDIDGAMPNADPITGAANNWARLCTSGPDAGRWWVSDTTWFTYGDTVDVYPGQWGRLEDALRWGGDGNAPRTTETVSGRWVEIDACVAVRETVDWNVPKGTEKQSSRLFLVRRCDDRDPPGRGDLKRYTDADRLRVGRTIRDEGSDRRISIEWIDVTDPQSFFMGDGSPSAASKPAFSPNGYVFDSDPVADAPINYALRCTSGPDAGRWWVLSGLFSLVCGGGHWGNLADAVRWSGGYDDRVGYDDPPVVVAGGEWVEIDACVVARETALGDTRISMEKSFVVGSYRDEYWQYRKGWGPASAATQYGDDTRLRVGNSIVVKGHPVYVKWVEIGVPVLKRTSDETVCRVPATSADDAAVGQWSLHRMPRLKVSLPCRYELVDDVRGASPASADDLDPWLRHHLQGLVDQNLTTGTSHPDPDVRARAKVRAAAYERVIGLLDDAKKRDVQPKKDSTP